MQVINVIISCIVSFLLFFSVPIISNKVIKYKDDKRSRDNKLVYYSEPNSFLLFSMFFVAFVSIYISLSLFEIWRFIFILIFIFIACIGTYIDIKVRIIPNEMIMVLMGLGILYRFGDEGFIGGAYGVLTAVGMFAFLVASFFLAKSFFIHIQPGGAGDLKLMMAVAIIVGYPDILVSVFACMVSYIVFVSFGILFKRIKMTSYLPMAGFIMFGLIFGLVWRGDVADVIKVFF